MTHTLQRSILWIIIILIICINVICLVTSIYPHPRLEKNDFISWSNEIVLLPLFCCNLRHSNNVFRVIAHLCQLIRTIVLLSCTHQCTHTRTCTHTHTWYHSLCIYNQNKIYSDLITSYIRFKTMYSCCEKSYKLLLLTNWPVVVEIY